MNAVKPPNYPGKITDCTAIILRNGEKDYPRSVNVAYAVILDPALRGMTVAATKAQYRPGKDQAVDVKRQLIRLELEDDTQEAFVRLAESSSEEYLQVAVSGLLRAVSAKSFDGKSKTKPSPEPEDLEWSG